jgi:ferrous iron transport protein B
MLYAPCFVTLVVMKKETAGWRWPLFAMVYTTLLAYVVALAVSGVGRALGVGV